MNKVEDNLQKLKPNIIMCFGYRSNVSSLASLAFLVAFQGPQGLNDYY